MAQLAAIASKNWPEPSASHSQPVAVFLHGYGADEQDLASLSALLPQDMAWASVRAPLALPWGGHAWFNLSDANNPDASEVAAATSLLWDWLDQMLPPHTPIVPIGFSQGGMIAIELLTGRPEQIGPLVFLSSYVIPSTRQAQPPTFPIRPQVFWGRGDQDPLFTPDTISQTHTWLHTHADVTEVTYPGLGHGISQEEVEDIRSFLARHLEQI